MSGKNRILKNLYKQAGRAYFSVYVSLYETKKNAKIPYKSIIYGGEDGIRTHDTALDRITV
jgi:hypothetical protein